MKLTHAVQKEAVSRLVDHIISIKDEEERRKSLIRLSYMIEKVYGGMFERSTFEKVRWLLCNNHKWWKYLNRALDTLNPHIIKTAVMDLGFEAAFMEIRNAGKTGRNTASIFPGSSFLIPPAHATATA